MNIAWFRDAMPDASNPLDDTAALIDELRATHAIDVLVEADAHDFVWRHFLTPWDLCVYELDNARAHQFVWAYLLNYPGIVLLKSPAVRHNWGGALSREGRLDDYMAGFRFGEGTAAPTGARVPLLASRSVVVSHAVLAESFQEAFPAARVRYAPLSTPNYQLPTPRANMTSSVCRFAVLDDSRLKVVERAFARAREAGAAIDLITGDSPARVLAACDVVVALTWPPFEAPLRPALAGMAAGKPVVTLELEATADWPALDPQTFRPRGLVATGSPIVVTIDPRDEEHSLMLVMRRLASDATLREQLGRAGYAWWQTHATPAHAAAAWNQILEEAARLAPPPRPDDWPKYLDADGTELADAILREFGLTSPTRSQARS